MNVGIPESSFEKKKQIKSKQLKNVISGHILKNIDIISDKILHISIL